MAVCKQCGARLSSFSFGELADYCANCKHAAPAKTSNDVLDGIAESGVLPYPWLTASRLLLAMNIAIFLAMIASGTSLLLPESADLIRWGADYGPLTLAGEYWRVLTSAFVHIGVLHLALNMWCLWKLGTLCERLLGHATTFGVYVVGGCGASLLSLSWDPMRVSAGASGAIFAIVGALAAVLQFGKLELPAERRRKLFRYVAQFAILNLVIGLAGNIDNMAHLGGLVSGLILGFFLARTFPQTEESASARRKVVLAGLLAVVLVFIPVASAKRYLVEAEQGADALSRGEYGTAARHFQEWARLTPDDPVAHSQLGYALERLERYPEAMRAYERTLALEPLYPIVERNLAGLYLDAGRVKEAVAMYARAVTRKEADADTFRGYGKALFADGDLDAAEALLRKSIIEYDADPEVHFLLADVLAARGKKAEAAQVRKKAEELTKQSEDQEDEEKQQ